MRTRPTGLRLTRAGLGAASITGFVGVVAALGPVADEPGDLDTTSGPPADPVAEQADGASKLAVIPDDALVEVPPPSELFSIGNERAPLPQRPEVPEGGFGSSTSTAPVVDASVPDTAAPSTTAAPAPTSTAPATIAPTTTAPTTTVQPVAPTTDAPAVTAAPAPTTTAPSAPSTTAAPTTTEAPTTTVAPTTVAPTTTVVTATSTPSTTLAPLTNASG